MKKTTTNIAIIVLMLISVPMIIGGDTYLYGASLLTLSVIISMIVIFRRHAIGTHPDRMSALSWAALAIWTFMVVSFLLLISGVSLFGAGLDGLGNWAKMSAVLGVAGVILTGTELVRSSRL